MYRCSKERMEDKIKTFSTFGATGNGGITRYSLSEADIMARKEFEKRMTAIGAEIEYDDVGNVYATIAGSEEGLPRIVTGSHTDSVKSGGNYDGILGVMSGMEALETVVDQNIPHRHPLTAMIWTNEEGSLYPPAMMVSGVVTGKFDKETVMDAEPIDADAGAPKTFGEALEKSGYVGDEANRLNNKDYQCMFEVHIEQGPILENANKDIGVVTCVVGMLNYSIIAEGIAAHAGTFPMHLRKDAFWAASKALDYLHTECNKYDPELVYTTGQVKCHPNIHTIVPDYFEFMVDSRHEDPEILKEVLKVIENVPEEIAGCKMSTKMNWTRDTVYFDEELVQFVEDSANELGFSNMRINSGAGHDAQYVTDLMPTTMIFVPSKDGLSHTEVEHTSVEECTNGASVLLNAMLKADQHYNK